MHYLTSDQEIIYGRNSYYSEGGDQMRSNCHWPIAACLATTALLRRNGIRPATYAAGLIFSCLKVPYDGARKRGTGGGFDCILEYQCDFGNNSFTTIISWEMHFLQKGP